MAKQNFISTVCQQAVSHIAELIVSHNCRPEKNDTVIKMTLCTSLTAQAR